MLKLQVHSRTCYAINVDLSYHTITTKFNVRNMYLVVIVVVVILFKSFLTIKLIAQPTKCLISQSWYRGREMRKKERLRSSNRIGDIRLFSCGGKTRIAVRNDAHC